MTRTLASKELATECETMFQSGGPRVYIRRTDGVFRPSVQSAKRTQEYAFPGEQVFARQKVKGCYNWVAFKVKEQS